MKVIRTDNYDREWMPQHLVKENLTEVEAKDIADKLNNLEEEVTEDFYMVVPNDYRLTTSENYW